MLRKPWIAIAFTVSALALILTVAGCGSDATTPKVASNREIPPATTAAAAESTASPSDIGTATVEEHGHKPGMHGGLIVPIGRDSYHAEAVFEQGGTLRLFMLGQDEGRVQEVETQSLTAYAKAEGGVDSVAFTLEPEPLADDAEGQTSQFVGTLPEDLTGQPVEVTIPSLRIKGERFRLGFASVVEHEAAAAHGGAEMPDKVANDAERELYLTPGGHYTVADIAANGNVTATQKFKGFRAKHDMHPKPGDKVCPITMTKANPECAWVVGGKTYEFCCPPCVDEFVAVAKAGGEIGEPEDYVKE